MVAVLVVVTTVAMAARWSILALAPPLIVAALTLAFVTQRRSRQRREPAPAKTPTAVRLVALAWLGLPFVFAQKFTAQGLSGSSVSRGSGPSVENLLQIGFHLLLVGLLVLAWRGPVGVGTPSLGIALIAWPGWALLSSTWSSQPAYSFVRAALMCVPVVLTLYSARLLRDVGDDGAALARPFLSLYVNVSALLVLLALAFPWTRPVAEAAPASAALVQPVEAQVVSATQGRLSWYGVHPLVAAEIWGVAALIVAIAGPQLLRLSRTGWSLRLLILLVGTVRAEGRSVYVGVLLALLVGLWVRLRGRYVPRLLVVAYYLALCGALGFILRGHLLHALERGGTTQALLNLNGRIPLWQLALQQLRSLKEVFLGFGFGTSGTLLSPEVGFAGHSHNFLIEALIGTGVVGMVLFGIWLSRIGWGLRTNVVREFLPARLHAVLVATFAVLVVLGITSPEPATPGFAYSMICFIAVFTVRGSARTTGRGATPVPPPGLRSGAFPVSGTDSTVPGGPRTDLVAAARDPQRSGNASTGPGLSDPPGGLHA